MRPARRVSLRWRGVTGPQAARPTRMMIPAAAPRIARSSPPLPVALHQCASGVVMSILMKRVTTNANVFCRPSI